MLLKLRMIIITVRRYFIQLLLEGIDIRLHLLPEPLGRLQVLTDIPDLLPVLVQKRLRVGEYLVDLLISLGYFRDILIIVILYDITNGVLLLFQLLPVFVNVFVRLADESIVHSEIDLLETSDFGVLLFKFLDETAVECFLLAADFAVTFSLFVTGHITCLFFHCFIYRLNILLYSLKPEGSIINRFTEFFNVGR